MAYATAPDGYYVQLGDTDPAAAIDIPGRVSPIRRDRGPVGPETASVDPALRRRLPLRPLRLGGDRPPASIRENVGPASPVRPGCGRIGSSPGQPVVTVEAGLAFNGRAKTAFGCVGKANVYYASMTNPDIAAASRTADRCVWSRITDYCDRGATCCSTAATRSVPPDLAGLRSSGSAPTISGNQCPTPTRRREPRDQSQLVGKPSLPDPSQGEQPISRAGCPRTYNVRAHRGGVAGHDPSAPSRAGLTLLVPYSGTRPAISGRVVSLRRARLRGGRDHRHASVQ